jgi:hypothetical protein
MTRPGVKLHTTTQTAIKTPDTKYKKGLTVTAIPQLKKQVMNDKCVLQKCFKELMNFT